MTLWGRPEWLLVPLGLAVAGLAGWLLRRIFGGSKG